MLILPPKVAQALEAAVATPVLVARFTTRVLDQIFSLYHDWTTGGEDPASEGHVISQHRTHVIQEHTLTENPQSFVEMLYPAQPGDPVQTVPAFVMDTSTHPQQLPLVRSYAKGVWLGDYFQSFLLDFGSPLEYAVPTVTVKLRRVAGDFPINLHAEIWGWDWTSAPGNPASTGRPTSRFVSNTRSSASLSTTQASVNFTFSPAAQVTRGLVYLLVLVVEGISQVGAWGGDNVFVALANGLPTRGHWAGMTSAEGGLGEAPGVLRLYRWPGYVMDCRVHAQAYSYDGVTTNSRTLLYDFGRIPEGTGYVTLDVGRPGDSTLTCRLWGRDPLVSPTTDVPIGRTDDHTLADHGHDGSVVHVHDGDLVEALYQQYLIQLLFTSPSLLYSARVHRAGLVFIESQHLFSTRPLPTLGAIPALAALPSVPITLDIKRAITPTQKWSITLADLGDRVSRMIAQEHFKGSNVELFLGFEETAPRSITDLAPVAFGRVVDFAYETGQATIEVQDRTKDLAVKVPRPILAESHAPVVVNYGLEAPTHLVQVIDDLAFTQVRLARRYQDLESFVAARAALPDDFVTTRSISEQDSADASTLLGELLLLVGGFLVPLEDGALRLIRYPRTDTAVDTWTDDDLLDPGQQKTGLSETLVNRVLVKYNYSDIDQDYLGFFSLWDQAAAAAWAPGSEFLDADQTIESKWIQVPALAPHLPQAIAARIIGHQKNGVIPIARRTTLAKYRVQVGDFVTLSTPIYLRKGRQGTGAQAVTFMVTSKTPRWTDGTIDWTLVEAYPANYPPLVWLLATPEVGATDGSPLGLTVAVEAIVLDPDNDAITAVQFDWDYDGRRFEVDHALSAAQLPGAITDGHTPGTGRGRPVSGHRGHKPHRHVTVEAASVSPPEPLTHTYSTADFAGRPFLLAACRVIDARGAASITTAKIRRVSAPTAVVQVVQTDPAQPLLVELHGDASRPGSGEIVHYEWDLSYDGVTLTAEAVGPRVFLTLPWPTVDVALRVTDEDGLTDLETVTIAGKTAPPAPVVGFAMFQVGGQLHGGWRKNTEPDLSHYELRYVHEPTGGQTTVWEQMLTLDAQQLTNAYSHPVLRPFGAYLFAIKAVNTSGLVSATPVYFLVTLQDPETLNVQVARDESALGFPGTLTDLTLINTTAAYSLGLPATVRDTFTVAADTLLSAQIGETGHNWPYSSPGWGVPSQYTAYASTDSAGRSTGSATLPVVSSWVPPTADYWAEVVGSTSAGVNRYFAVAVRSQAMATVNHRYEARIVQTGASPTTGEWRLYRITASTTLLASGAIAGFNPTQAYRLRLEAYGPRLRVYVDDVQVTVGSPDLTDGAITVVGKAGLAFGSDSTPRITEFTAGVLKIIPPHLRLAPSNLTGSYLTPVINLGAVVRRSLLTVVPVAEGDPDLEGVTVTVEERHSDDNVAFTPWATIRSGEYAFRSIQERLSLTQPGGSPGVEVLSFNLLTTIDVEDIRDWDNGIDVPAGSPTYHVAFAVAFNVAPTVTYRLSSGEQTHYAKITNVTTTGFDVSIHQRSDDANVGSGGVRLFGFVAEGY
jgi:hypothetical protein